jgi:hypothetical protein
VINEPGHVCVWSQTCEGNASDQSLAELAGSTFPPGRCLDHDNGCQGFFLPGLTMVQPKKTPPGGALRPPEPETKRRLAASRLRIEQAMGGVKRARIVKDQRRLLKDGIRDRLMETWCGLHHVRLQYRPWHYAL